MYPSNPLTALSVSTLSPVVATQAVSRIQTTDTGFFASLNRAIEKESIQNKPLVFSNQPAANAATMSHEDFVKQSIKLFNDAWGIKEGEPIVISEFAKKADETLKNMTKRVQAELAAAGIELKPPVEFSVGADGLEAAPHPMSDRIKAVMSQHNALFDEYQNALIMKAEALSLQRADEATQAYYAAYENKKFDLAHQIIRNLAAAGPIRITQSFGIA